VLVSVANVSVLVMASTDGSR